jgi:hypothetical protein
MNTEIVHFFSPPMTMNPLPPQAYTKETLVKAYQWLQHQNDSIKELATSPDILVSLFLKAKLQGDGALERPSIQNFKNELKNLAGMMGEFEIVEPTSAPVSAPAAAIAPAPAMVPPPQAPMAAAAVATPPAASSTAPGKNRPLPELDTRSWLMIQEVKTQLNLSSDQEALRVLISVGHSKVKALMSEK